MSDRRPTDQERARKQAALVLADAAQRIETPEPNTGTLMSILNILQEAYGFPAGYHFSLYVYGPQAKLGPGTLPQAERAAGEAQPPKHDFQDHVTRFTQDMAGAGPKTLSLYSKLIFANRRMGVATGTAAAEFIGELSPQIPRADTQAAWTFLSRRDLVRRVPAPPASH